ncbi:prepilin-type N-terminal cleavage/methylation domain-containing protein [Variovorax guangxiensis]|uniref:Prepilin-type N-terminal cleavage/methylation domain-containing protein n=1 Tax=Variovorax guangxiensis TaxID=1775474 RepID=A0A433MTQ8_9BURK|nr:type IV pilin protein [Variovorax guangxiensis]RUR71253.1 prepilin-type N-terminal cleavage/methylation domain-containing protein [Variovorax guangxiensis]
MPHTFREIKLKPTGIAASQWPNHSSPHSRYRSSEAGFTLIEMMIVVALIAILAAIALPSYESYVRKSRARAAGADLGALALNMENVRQLQLDYKVFARGTKADSKVFSGWSASMSQYFSYTVESTASTYLLKASGISGSAGCELSLDNAGVKSASSACGFSTW